MSLFAILFSLLLNPLTAETSIPAGTDHLLVKTASNEFTVLTNSGFYTGINNEFSQFISYKDSTSLISTTPLKDFKICYINNTPYLLSPIEGHLYQFKDSLLTRIDKDVRKGYDYSPLFIPHKDKLYTLGGDVIFNNKNGLRVFDWESKTWKIIPTEGEIPPGVKNGLYQLINDELWVFHSNEVDQNLDETFVQNAYSLNFNTFKWKKQGIINPDFIDASQNIPLQAVISKEGLLVYNRENTKVFLVDISTNTFVETKLTSNDTFDSNIIHLENNNWEFTTNFKGNIELNSAKLNKNTSSNYFIRNQSIFQNKGMEILSISALILIVFIGYLFISKRKFKLSHEALSNGLKKIPLTDEEVKFLKILAKNKIVLNNEAMDIINDPNTTYDANIKRKNNLVSKIERKLKKTFREVLFTRQRYKDDMRHTAFYLKDGFSITCLHFEDE